MKIFIDTSIFLALHDLNDPTHKKAHDLLEKTANTDRLITSSDAV